MAGRADPTTAYDNMSTAVDGGAVQNGADPYARSYASPYNQYVGWQQEETPVTDGSVRQNSTNYQDNGARAGLTKQGAAWYGRDATAIGPSKPNHLIMINDRVENYAITDEGPDSVNPTPGADGRDWSEPSNDSGRWKSGRIIRAGVGYTFFRYWWKGYAAETQAMQGAHVSLADNAVVMPVGGMNPNLRKNMRNTYRIDPAPWDLNYTDLNTDPRDNSTPPASSYPPPNVQGRSYRLG